MIVPNESTSFLHNFSSSSSKLDAGVRALKPRCDRAESREGVVDGGSNYKGATETSRTDTRFAISECCDLMHFFFYFYRGRKVRLAF